MAKYCPVKNGAVLYLECMECEERECEKYRTPSKKKNGPASVDIKDSCSTN